jgi:hypothetical protein
MVRATSLGAPVLSGGLLNALASSRYAGDDTPAVHATDGRDHFPQIISAISNGDLTVTDHEVSQWDGRLDWIPSYALTTENGMAWPAMITYDTAHILDAQFQELGKTDNAVLCNDRAMICELYRVATMIFRRQSRRDVALPQAGMGNLPSWGAQLIHHLPVESVYSNMLLWPIGVITKELTIQYERERDQIVSKLMQLEAHFGMQHFARIRLYLDHFWFSRDHQLEVNMKNILFG